MAHEVNSMAKLLVARYGALWRDVLVMTEHILRVVAALESDEPVVLGRAIDRAETALRLIGHEIDVGARREGLHGLPGLADPGDVTIGIGVRGGGHLPGAHDVQVVLRLTVREGGGVLGCARDGAALREERHGRET